MPEKEPKDFREEHYTPSEVAKLWGVSPDWIRRRFMCEPGVLILSVPKVGKRRYSVIRIPASVEARVYAELSFAKSPKQREFPVLTRK